MILMSLYKNCITTDLQVSSSIRLTKYHQCFPCLSATLKENQQFFKAPKGLSMVMLGKVAFANSFKALAHTQRWLSSKLPGLINNTKKQNISQKIFEQPRDELTTYTSIFTYLALHPLPGSSPGFCSMMELRTKGWFTASPSAWPLGAVSEFDLQVLLGKLKRMSVKPKKRGEETT